MKHITIGFSEPRDTKIGSSLIKWWINKPYSHTFLMWYSDDLDRVLIYHAAHGTVHFVGLDRFLEENQIIKHYDLTIPDDIFNKLVVRAIDLAAIKYSYLELIQILFYDMNIRLFDKEVPLTRDQLGYICSELLGEFCVQYLGMQFAKPTYLLRPDDIEDALEQYMGEHYNEK